MNEKKSGNGQMENNTGGMEDSGKNGKCGKNVLSKFSSLVHLWPAALVIVLIVGTLPMTDPVLREIPQLLTIDAKASVKAETEEAAEETERAAEGNFEDGVYKGTGTGYGGSITVEVTVENGNIISVEILSAPGENASFLKRAGAVIDSVILSQSWEVDVVSGATYSSRGILAAIQNALTGEKVETETAPVQETQPLVKTEFEEPEGYIDGTYYGSARGFGGTIQVKVVISDGKIADISIVSASGETPSYLASAKAVVSRMLSAQSPNVDTVSGATYSSNGIINAVKYALSQAAGAGVSDDLTVNDHLTDESAGPAGSAAAPQKNPAVIKNPDVSVSEAGYADGVYTGTAEGFGGDITVQVTISGGKIVSVEIISAEDETPSYLKQAERVTDRIVAAQSTDVDVVSGATYSSCGIINAAAEALEKAKPAEPASGEENNSQTGTGNTENSDQEDTKKPDTENAETPDAENTEQPGSDHTAEAEENTAKYKDGIYQASMLCADEDTFIYTVQVTITIADGQITEIAVEKLDDQSEYPEDNDTYLDYAINGRTRKNIWYEGVVKQILTAQSAEHVDAVSSATYSSNAITGAAQDALEQALMKERPAAGEEDPAAGTQDSAAEEPSAGTEASSAESTESSETESTESSETESSESAETDLSESAETAPSENVSGENCISGRIFRALADLISRGRFLA